MGRFVVAVMCLGAFASPVAAERIGVDHGPAASLLESDFVWTEAFLGAATGAADSDWRQSTGTDVWWFSSDAFQAQVMMFRTLHRPGQGEPRCCVSFPVGDAEFWVKVRKALSGPPNGSPEDGNWLPTTSAGGTASSGASDAPASTDQGSPSSPGSGHSQTETPPSPGSSDAGESPMGVGAISPEPLQTQPDLTGRTEQSAIAQVPEPGLTLLLTLGLGAAVRRLSPATRQK